MYLNRFLSICIQHDKILILIQVTLKALYHILKHKAGKI